MNHPKDVKVNFTDTVLTEENMAWDIPESDPMFIPLIKARCTQCDANLHYNRTTRTVVCLNACHLRRSRDDEQFKADAMATLDEAMGMLNRSVEDQKIAQARAVQDERTQYAKKHLAEHMHEAGLVPDPPATFEALDMPEPYDGAMWQPESLADAIHRLKEANDKLQSSPVATDAHVSDLNADTGTNTPADDQSPANRTTARNTPLSSIADVRSRLNVCLDFINKCVVTDLPEPQAPDTLDELEALARWVAPLLDFKSSVEALYSQYEDALKQGLTHLYETGEDKDTKSYAGGALQISVSSVPDKWDADAVAGWLTKEGLLNRYLGLDKAKVLRAINDGHIDVPAEVVTMVERSSAKIITGKLLALLGDDE